MIAVIKRFDCILDAQMAQLEQSVHNGLADYRKRCAKMKIGFFQATTGYDRVEKSQQSTCGD